MKQKGISQLVIFLFLIALLTISCNFITNMVSGESNNNTEDETSLQEEPEESSPDPTTEPTAEPSAVPTIEPTQKPPRATATPEESKNCFTDDIGFTIKLPNSWICLNLTDEELTDLLTEAFTANPQMAENFSTEYLMSLAESGMKLFVIIVDNPSSNKGIYASMNVFAVASSFGVSLNDYTDATLQQINDMFDETISFESEFVIIGDLEVNKITYEAEVFVTDGTSQILTFQQYMLIENNIYYAITFGSPVADFAVMEPLFTDAIQTFLITD